MERGSSKDVGAPAGRDLERRVRWQEAVAGLGMSALSGKALSSLMDEAVRLVAGTLCVDHAKILELLPDGDRLLVRAGVGWNEGTVGVATVGTNLESQAGYTLISDGPVICEDLHEEVRFKGAPLLHEHGIISGVTVAILIEGLHHGVLGAHTTERRAFTEVEARFLEDLAGVLGAAIEREKADGRSRTRIAERTKRAEAAEQRFEFLAEANALLSASPWRVPGPSRACRSASGTGRAGLWICSPPRAAATTPKTWRSPRASPTASPSPWTAPSTTSPRPAWCASCSTAPGRSRAT